jgi:hypothetical protein
LTVDSNFVCDYFDIQAGLLARLAKILANV